MGYPSCMASMNYFDSDMYNSTNTVEYFDWKDDNLYLRLRAMSHTIYAGKFIYLDDKLSIAHARCAHLSHVIQSQNKIIYTVVKVLQHLCSLKIINISKINKYVVCN
jgi:hypothetical protein